MVCRTKSFIKAWKEFHKKNYSFIYRVNNTEPSVEGRSINNKFNLYLHKTSIELCSATCLVSKDGNKENSVRLTKFLKKNNNVFKETLTKAAKPLNTSTQKTKETKTFLKAKIPPKKFIFFIKTRVRNFL